MKKLNSSELVLKKDGGEYIVSLNKGDAFISFHHATDDCMGFYLKANEIKVINLEQIFSRMISLSPKKSLENYEVKLITSSQGFLFFDDYFKLKKIGSVKKVEKNFSVDVIFLPAQCKVRVGIEPSSIVGNSKKLLPKTKFKVLIVDDSKTIRNILSKIFTSDPDFIVCAMAERPSEVEALILKHKPDVITLDIHMPEMDGVALLKKIAPKYNIPTVMISSISMAEGPLVLEALENGAVDYIQKPELSEIESVTPLIIEKVRTAASANLSKGLDKRRNSRAEQVSGQCDLSSFIVLGASTGGTEAIREIITALPSQIPPMLIVQHIPAVFSLAFAKRMNDLCPFEVKEAEDGDEVRANRILIAPGGKQMKFVAKNGKAFVEINEDAPVNRFKPSVDYMFLSVAQSIFTHTIAVILTGMGKDGAKGMLELRKQGARTIAQDEYTSVVFGMPKEAIALGGAEFVEPLSSIAQKITVLTKEKIPLKKIS